MHSRFFREKFLLLYFPGQLEKFLNFPMTVKNRKYDIDEKETKCCKIIVKITDVFLHFPKKLKKMNAVKLIHYF